MPVSGGVNFLEAYTYNTSATVLANTMSKFATRNVKLIFLGAYWSYIEPSSTPGNWQDPNSIAYIKKLQDVVTAAAVQGIEVSMCLFTRTGSGSATIPSFIPSQYYLNCITNATYRQYWVNMLAHLASIFGNTVHSYVPLDEPQGAYVAVAADCITAWGMARDAIHAYSTKPFAIRYDAAYFSQFQPVSGFWNVNDFACFNWYEDWMDNPPSGSGDTVANFNKNVALCQAAGKRIIIGGCGYSSPPANDSNPTLAQATHINTAIQMFNPYVDYCMAWYWSSLSWLPLPGWNLCADSGGNPRTTPFAALTQYNTASPPTTKKYVFQKWQDGDVNPTKTVTV